MKSNIDYEAIFRSALPFSLHDLRGVYYIRMLKPAIPSYWFNHYKLFRQTPLRVYGYNYTARRRWGNFIVSQAMLDDGYAVLIDYDRSDNGWTVRHLRDYVRKLGKGNYIGKLYWKGKKGEVFLGYFLMCREKEAIRDYHDILAFCAA